MDCSVFNYRQGVNTNRRIFSLKSAYLSGKEYGEDLQPAAKVIYQTMMQSADFATGFFRSTTLYALQYLKEFASSGFGIQALPFL
jgi:hypothetical protein